MVQFEFLDFHIQVKLHLRSCNHLLLGCRPRPRGRLVVKTEKKGQHHLNLHAESPIAQLFLLKCSSATLCFRCFPFLAASSREPALKWMIACDRRIKSINPTLIKRGMMNQERQLWAHLCCHLNRIKALNHKAAPGNRRGVGVAF